jgi:AcrR family transcriptional regulator
MCPRPYNLGLRQASAEQTRGRIIEAARALLSDDAFDGFAVDAIARRAGVARMTVYYQFTSRRGLLEALYDDLAARGLVGNLPAMLQASDATSALMTLAEVFARFWASDRLIIRRLRGLAVIDREVEASIRERDGLRRQHVGNLLHRIAEEHGWQAALSIEEATEIVAVVIGFETYDALAPAGADPATTAELLQRSVRAMLSLT